MAIPLLMKILNMRSSNYEDPSGDVVLIGAIPHADRIAAKILWFDRGIVGNTRELSCGDRKLTVVVPDVAIGRDSSLIFLEKHLYYA